MAKTCRVSFRPNNVSVRVPASTTILTAANKTGIFIDSLCGGDGVCGRCRVIVREGAVTGGSTDCFTHAEIQQGYILACEARIQSDVLVEIPPEPRLTTGLEFAESEVPYLADLNKLIRYARLSPLVRKTYLQLSPPSLDDNISDLQRIEQALARKIPDQSFQMGLKVMRRLPHVLRQSNWKVTAITGHRGPLTEIIDIEAGDTTRPNMCIAADVGTTTICCHLVDLEDGQTFGQAAKYNSQVSYGADVIRRIIYASQSEANRNSLREAMVGDLNELIGKLLSKHRMGAKDISLITVAGNTAMIHLLLGLPAENVRREPYIGATYHLPPFRAAEIGLQIHPRGLLYCLPCVAGFVGADTVAGIFATALSRSDEVRMFIDIGTNGEVVIGNNEFLVCASASAGPAFEGAECTDGMRAVPGAIDHIRLLDPDNVLTYSTIGSAPPIGMCGTGYVDIIAEMLRVGIIDKTGRLQPGASDSRVRKGPNGELEYVVMLPAQSGNDKGISISQSDINNILRAKAAIFAASSVLLNALDMKFSDLGQIMVAGAVGNFLNIENAIFIGLLPDLPTEKLLFVGNTSLAGAKLAALRDSCYAEISRIASSTTYYELSTDPTFMDEFVSACFFPHTNVELFPTVTAALQSEKERQHAR